jgi:hypothetical protein
VMAPKVPRGCRGRPAVADRMLEIAIIVALFPFSPPTIWLFLGRTLLSSYCSAPFELSLLSIWQMPQRRD